MLGMAVVEAAEHQAQTGTSAAAIHSSLSQAGRGSPALPETPEDSRPARHSGFCMAYMFENPGLCMITIKIFGQALDLSFLVKFTIAYLLALPIALDRERSHRSAGLRTFPIVSMASCRFLLLARDLFGLESEPMARVLYGLMTGIGFIGGGAIVKGGDRAHGTATAASIWSTAAIGAAVAVDRYGIAVAIALFTVGTLLLFKPVKDAID